MLPLFRQTSFIRNVTWSKFAIIFNVSQRPMGELSKDLGIHLLRKLDTRQRRCLPAYKYLLNLEITWFQRFLHNQDHLLLCFRGDSLALRDSNDMILAKEELHGLFNRFHYSQFLWVLLDFPHSVAYLPPDNAHIFYCDEDLTVKEKSGPTKTKASARPASCFILAVKGVNRSQKVSLGQAFNEVILVSRGRVSLMHLLQALHTRLQDSGLSPVLYCNRPTPLEKTFFYYG